MKTTLRSPSQVTITVATRRSALALAQCRAFVQRLLALDPTVRLEQLEVVTTGDRVQDRPLADIGGKGLFVKEIEEALLEGKADLAVHSIKDVPGQLPPGLVIACIPEREDARDVLVVRSGVPGAAGQGAPGLGGSPEPAGSVLAGLPAGATVGTSSLRRMVSLKAARPDLVVLPVRGNVDTRLRKLDEGQFDAIVLARAGLVRLGLAGRTTEILSPDVSLPAVGQGALGIECRADDVTIRERLAPLHDPETATCVAAERGVLIALGGDCKTPLAAYAERVDGSIRLRAFVAADEAAPVRRAQREAPWPTTTEEAHELGLSVGRALT